MKRKLKKILLIFLFLITLLSGYYTYNFIETKIIYDKYCEKYSILNWGKFSCYGRVNGDIIVRLYFPGKDCCATEGYDIENFDFSFDFNEGIYIYKDKELYSLEEAYDLGYVDLKQVVIIYCKHKIYKKIYTNR